MKTCRECAKARIEYKQRKGKRPVEEIYCMERRRIRKETDVICMLFKGKENGNG